MDQCLMCVVVDTGMRTSRLHLKNALLRRFGKKTPKVGYPEQCPDNATSDPTCTFINTHTSSGSSCATRTPNTRTSTFHRHCPRNASDSLVYTLCYSHCKSDAR